MAELLQFPSSTLLAASQQPAPVSSGAPADAEARAVALDPRRSFLVEAPAGSGKTALLIQRFLILLALPEVNDPAEVLAITFTRDATAELRDRVLDQLRRANEEAAPRDRLDSQVRPLAQAVLRRDRELGWQLLDDPRRLRIQTIDAVCAEIARSLPVLAGAGAHLRPTDEPRPLYAEAARRTLAQLGGSDRQLSAALEQILLHRDANLQDTESLLSSMLEVRDQWAGLIPLAAPGYSDEVLDREVLPQLEKALLAAISGTLRRLLDVIPAGVLDELCQFAAEHAHLDGYKGAVSPLAVCAGRHRAPGHEADDLPHWQALIHLLLTAGGTVRQPGGLNRKTVAFDLDPKKHKPRLTAVLEQVAGDEPLRAAMVAVRRLPPPHYPKSQWVVTRALFRVLTRALAELQVIFSERGECDFAELNLLARTALRREGAGQDLMLSSGARLQHLLVDEVQDTSAGQYDFLHLLTESWDGYSQTLFLVGDPKQSIYLFREARMESFLDTMQRGRLGSIPLTVLHLSANFRSQAELVESFNEDFGSIFGDDEPGAVSIPYLPATATRPQTEPEPRHWYATEVSNREAQSEQTEVDAKRICEAVARWRARPLPAGRTRPWRVAVLVRSRSHLLPIIAAMRAWPEPITYRAVEIEPLRHRPEILDLLALTRSLMHPADRTAWLALLRSPLCGLSLDALHTLTGADEDALRHSAMPELLKTRAELLDPEEAASALRLRSIMEAALHSRANLPVSEWVYRTWMTFGADRYLDEQAQTNARRYFELLDKLTDSGRPGDRLNLPQLTARLEKLYSQPSAATDTVDLLTIHAAKGLEWDMVVVPSLERRGGSDRARLLLWLDVPDTDPTDNDAEPSTLGLLAPIQARGEDAEALNCWMGAVARARETAEVKRLFYVACTRAREELHLFAATTRNKSDGQLCAPAGTLLCAAMPAAEPHFAPARTSTSRSAETPYKSSETPAILPFPAPARKPEVQPGVLMRLAAEAPSLYRIPVEATLPISPRPPDVPPTRLARPTGSHSSRIFGNTVHLWLETLTRRMAEGFPATQLAGELPGWRQRIHSTFRAGGLAAEQCRTLTGQALRLLQNTLNDPTGRWLLQPHPGASAEQAISATGGHLLRPDRTFLAGAEPLSEGDSHLWIVDYKTAAPGTEPLADFLLNETLHHAPQLERYRQVFANDSDSPVTVRLALYHPAVPAFTPL